VIRAQKRGDGGKREVFVCLFAFERLALILWFFKILNAEMACFWGFARKTTEISGLSHMEWLFSSRFEWWIALKRARYEGIARDPQQFYFDDVSTSSVPEVFGISQKFFPCVLFEKFPGPGRCELGSGDPKQR
jgi:hypothetical protein